MELEMVLEAQRERPEPTAHPLGRVDDPARRVARHALPVWAIIRDAAPDDLLDAFPELHVEVVGDEDTLARRGPPLEAAPHERGERICRRRLVAERLEQREEELLGRVGAPICKPFGTLLGGQGGDEVEYGGAAARRQPRGLAERRDPVDPRPVERLEHGEGGPVPRPPPPPLPPPQPSRATPPG